MKDHLVNIDDVLMDLLVQPVVDRLPDGVSCFDAARCNVTALRAVLLAIFVHQAYGRIITLSPVIIWLATLLLVRGISQAEALSRRGANPFRFMPADIFSTWVWVTFCAYDIVHNSMTGIFHFKDATDLLTNFFLLSTTVFYRARPRPPGVSRKPILPTSTAAFQGGTA